MKNVVVYTNAIGKAQYFVYTNTVGKVQYFGSRVRPSVRQGFPIV